MSTVTLERPDSAAAVTAAPIERRLTEVALRERVELVRIDLPADEMEPLLERGLLPGCVICPVRRSPFGDPVVEVEGVKLALRREMARCLCVRGAESLAS